MASRSPEEIRQLLGAAWVDDIQVYRASRVAMWRHERQTLGATECAALIAAGAIEKSGFAPAPSADTKAK